MCIGEHDHCRCHGLHRFPSRYSDYDDSLLDVSELQSVPGPPVPCDSCSPLRPGPAKGSDAGASGAAVPPDESFAPRLNQRLWQTADPAPGRIRGVPGGRGGRPGGGDRGGLQSLGRDAAGPGRLTRRRSAEAEIPVVDLRPRQPGPERVFARKAALPRQHSPAPGLDGPEGGPARAGDVFSTGDGPADLPGPGGGPGECHDPTGRYARLT
jgi:hypothetical protein